MLWDALGGNSFNRANAYNIPGDGRTGREEWILKWPGEEWTPCTIASGVVQLSEKKKFFFLLFLSYNIYGFFK